MSDLRCQKQNSALDISLLKLAKAFDFEINRKLQKCLSKYSFIWKMLAFWPIHDHDQNIEHKYLQSYT